MKKNELNAQNLIKFCVAQRLIQSEAPKACVASVRVKAVETFIPPKRKLKFNEYREVLGEALAIGGSSPKTYSFNCGKTHIEVCSLYELPDDMSNPYVYVFSGFMSAAFHAVEAIRFYYKKHGVLLPLTSTGRGGNKGLFESVFNRKKGLISGSECSSYLKIISKILGDQYAYQVVSKDATVSDTDTLGNLQQIEEDARNHSGYTAILISGNPFYTKRLVAEASYYFAQHNDVDVRVIVVQSPISLEQDKKGIPEEHLSEIYLGYAAAGIGALLKGAVPANGEPVAGERYFVPGLEKANWNKVKKLLQNFGSMNWPDFEEIVFNTTHETAVLNIIRAFVYAANDFNVSDYDKINESIQRYKNFLLNREFDEKKEDIGNYLLETTDSHYYQNISHLIFY